MLDLFSQFRASNVSVVASGVFVTLATPFVNPKAVRRGPGSPKLLYFFGKMIVGNVFECFGCALYYTFSFQMFL